MKEVIIASAVRTAVGKAPRGTLRSTRPDDLAAFAISGALERVPQLDKSEIEDVILGCAMPEAEQGMNVAKIASFRAGLPVTTAGMTINRYCASGLQSIAMAAERIRGGGAEAMLAGVLLGNRLHAAVPAAAVSKAVYALLVIAGLTLLARSL